MLVSSQHNAMEGVMIRPLIAGLLTCTALVSVPASAAVIVVSGIGTVGGVSPVNNFKTNLSGIGLTSFTNDYGSVDVVGTPAKVSVYRVASESSFHNTLTAFGSGPIAEPGPQPLSGWTPNDLVASAVYVGTLADVIKFFSDGVVPSFTFNSDRLGIFLPTGFAGPKYVTNNLYVGFDDVTRDPDDNHDDYIIRISVVPEPAAWLTMIAGFGMIGLSLRRGNHAVRTTIA